MLRLPARRSMAGGLLVCTLACFAAGYRAPDPAVPSAELLVVLDPEAPLSTTQWLRITVFDAGSACPEALSDLPSDAERGSFWVRRSQPVTQRVPADRNLYVRTHYKDTVVTCEATLAFLPREAVSYRLDFVVGPRTCTPLLARTDGTPVAVGRPGACASAP